MTKKLGQNTGWGLPSIGTTTPSADHDKVIIKVIIPDDKEHADSML